MADDPPARRQQRPRALSQPATPYRPGLRRAQRRAAEGRARRPAAARRQGPLRRRTGDGRRQGRVAAGAQGPQQAVPHRPARPRRRHPRACARSAHRPGGDAGFRPALLARRSRPGLVVSADRRGASRHPALLPQRPAQPHGAGMAVSRFHRPRGRQRPVRRCLRGCVRQEAFPQGQPGVETPGLRRPRRFRRRAAADQQGRKRHPRAGTPGRATAGLAEDPAAARVPPRQASRHGCGRAPARATRQCTVAADRKHGRTPVARGRRRAPGPAGVRRGRRHDPQLRAPGRAPVAHSRQREDPGARHGTA